MDNFFCRRCRSLYRYFYISQKDNYPKVHRPTWTTLNKVKGILPIVELNHRHLHHNSNSIAALTNQVCLTPIEIGSSDCLFSLLIDEFNIYFFYLCGALDYTVYSIQREYNLPVGSTTPSGDQNSQQPQPERRIVELTANKFSGVGPVSQEGVPIALRSVFISIKFGLQIVSINR